MTTFVRGRQRVADSDDDGQDDEDDEIIGDNKSHRHGIKSEMQFSSSSSADTALYGTSNNKGSHNDGVPSYLNIGRKSILSGRQPQQATNKATTGRGGRGGRGNRVNSTRSSLA